MQTVIQSDVNIIEFNDLTPLPYENACITIGNFDGVHLGHQAIITRMVQAARGQNRPVMVVTFFPNPALFFNHPAQPYYLSTPSEKERYLLALGVDKVITLRFNRELADLSALAFLTALKQKMGLDVLVIGKDFSLGKDRQGSITRINAIGQDLSFGVEIISQIKAGEEQISSTMIRHQLDRGAVDRAADLLGRTYQVSGVVTHGSDRGTKIGLPTANITVWAQKKLPGVGVYATVVHLHGQTHQGITNIGYRPTFEDQNQVNIETHILDFDGNIYGEKMNLAFNQKLRDEHKFPNTDAFLAQIELDKDKARRILQNAKI